MKTLLSTLTVLLAASLSSQLQASPIYPNCVAGSLASYEPGGANDSSCAIGGTTGGVEIIDGFLYSGPAGDDSLIQLVPDQVGLGGGFTYSEFPGAEAGQTLTFNIAFFYTIDSGPIGSGANLGMDPGNVNITESICVDSFFNNPFGGTSCSNQDTPQSLSVNNSSLEAENASITLNPPASFGADVEIRVVEVGGDTGASFTSVTANEIIDAPAPEPMTSLLICGGLIAIGSIRRYRSNG